MNRLLPFAGRMNTRQWATLAAEMLLLIVGILAALAIDGWVQRHDDRQSERTYLRLLVRDLNLTIQGLQAFEVSSAEMVDAGLDTYRSMIGPIGISGPDSISKNLSTLAVRHTVRLYQAAYTDLLSTGNLSLIENHELRDRLISFYETTGRQHLILEKNNDFFADDLFARFVMGEGLVVPWARGARLEVFDEGLEPLLEMLGEDIEHPDDRIATVEKGTEEWYRVIAGVWARTVVGFRGGQIAQGIIEDAEALLEELNAELGR